LPGRWVKAPVDTRNPRLFSFEPMIGAANVDVP
jgi:hypothetical protein